MAWERCPGPVGITRALMSILHEGVSAEELARLLAGLPEAGSPGASRTKT